LRGPGAPAGFTAGGPPDTASEGCYCARGLGRDRHWISGAAATAAGPPTPGLPPPREGRGARGSK
jgi:hypothetical protein